MDRDGDNRDGSTADIQPVPQNSSSEAVGDWDDPTPLSPRSAVTSVVFTSTPISEAKTEKETESGICDFLQQLHYSKTSTAVVACIIMLFERT